MWKAAGLTAARVQGFWRRWGFLRPDALAEFQPPPPRNRRGRFSSNNAYTTKNRTSCGFLSFLRFAEKQVNYERSASLVKSAPRHVDRTQNLSTLMTRRDPIHLFTMQCSSAASADRGKGSRNSTCRAGYDIDTLSATCTFSPPASASRVARNRPTVLQSLRTTLSVEGGLNGLGKKWEKLPAYKNDKLKKVKAHGRTEDRVIVTAVNSRGKTGGVPASFILASGHLQASLLVRKLCGNYVRRRSGRFGGKGRSREDRPPALYG